MQGKGVNVMKYMVLVLLALVLCYSYYTYVPTSGQSTTVEMNNESFGFVNYGSETLASVEANGYVTLDGTFVRKALHVNGNLNANKAKINLLRVNGRASLSDCTVEGKTDITGFLTAINTTFRSDVVVSAQRIRFSGCSIDQLVIKKPFWSFGKQVVELSDKTICKGPIIFESGNGRVVLAGNSQIIGSVNGALVEKL